MLSQLLRRQLQRMKKASKARRQSSAPIEAPDEPWHCRNPSAQHEGHLQSPTHSNSRKPRKKHVALARFLFLWMSFPGRCSGEGHNTVPSPMKLWSFASIYQYSFMKFGVAVVEWPIDSFQKEDSAPKSTKSTHPPNIRWATSLKCFGVLLGSAVF